MLGMKRLVPLLCASCLAAHAADSPKPGTFATTLQPGAMHEECARVEKGEQRTYHWKADAPVDFNIHRHEGNEVFYPVKRNAMRGDGGTFKAETGADYCWMWTARDKAAKLEGGISR